MRPYLEVGSGSIPLLLIASVARGEARNSINRFEAALSFEPATTAAAKTGPTESLMEGRRHNQRLPPPGFH